MKKTKNEKITKVIGFELKPVGKTRQTIAEKKILETDQEIHARVDAVKPLINAFYKYYINEALLLLRQTNSLFWVDFSELEAKYFAQKEKELEQDKKKTVRKVYQKSAEDGQKKFLAAFASVSPLKGNDLTSAKLLDAVLQFVREKLHDDPCYQVYEEAVINASGCSALLKRFMTTRITALSNAGKRMIENFETYCENKERIISFMKSPAFAELEKDYPEAASFRYADYYLEVVTQEGIDYYNTMISGKSGPEGILTKGFNVLVNEENTKNRNDRTYSGIFYRTLKKLDKQILYPTSKQFTIDRLENDEDARTLLKEMGQIVQTRSFLDMVSLIRSTDSKGIVVSGNNLHQLSFVCCGSHDTYPKALSEKFAGQKAEELRKAVKTAEKKKLEKEILNAESIVTSGSSAFTLEEVSSVCGNDVRKMYVSYLANLYEDIMKKKAAFDLSGIMERGSLQTKSNKTLVKDYLESICAFRNVLQIIARGADRDTADILFYEALKKQMECFGYTQKALNLMRNYLTRKPADSAKNCLMETYFGSVQKSSAKWWNGADKIDVGKNLILMKDGKYYYATMLPGNTLDVAFVSGISNYSILTVRKGANGMKNELPKKMYGQSNSTINVKKLLAGGSDFCEWRGMKNDMSCPVRISRKLFEAHEKGLKTKEAVKKKLCTEEERRFWEIEEIRLAQEILPLTASYCNINWQFKEPESYSSWLEFCAYCDTKAAHYEWIQADADLIDSLVEEGKMLLFLISHRDLYKNKKNPDSYVKLLEYLFSEENFKNPTIHLNGAPFFQYRRPVYPKTVTHKKGSILVDRIDMNGNKIMDDLYMEIYNYYQGYRNYDSLSDEAVKELPLIRTRKAWMDFTKNARYTQEKFLIRIVCTKNADVIDYGMNTMSEEVKEEVFRKERSVLAVSRGYRDLLYCVLFDKNKNILKRMSLNRINGIDYYELLKKLDRSRKSEKSDSWVYGVEIKDFRTHYIDLAIGEIVKCALEHGAVIVMEKVNDEYKDRMQMIDNQVYKTFEKRLEMRLNDCYDKKIPYEEEGSLINPFQLTKQKNLSSIQNGCVFYLNGAYTNFCPVSGFANFFNLSGISSAKQKKNFLSAMDWIRYAENCIRFSFDYKKMEKYLKNNWKDLKKEEKKSDYPVKTDWIVTAAGPVTRYDREAKKDIYVTDRIAEAVRLLEKYGCLADDGTVLMEKLKGKVLDTLYLVFREALLMTTVKKCRDVPEDYYVSPITGPGVKRNPSAIKAENLGRKFFYYIENGSVEGFVGYMQQKLRVM